MKKRFFISLLFILSQAPLLSIADETNQFYVIENDNDGVFLSQDAAKIHYNKLLDEAKKTRESLPAQDFSEGHWGEVVGGLLLSLRFEKTLYTNGEAIPAIILIRNTTNRFLSYPGAGSANMDGPVFLSISNEAGWLIPVRDVSGQPFSVSAGGTAGVHSGMQRKYVEVLNNRYDLTNGSYFVQASLRAFDAESDKPHRLDVKSAIVPIEIR